MKQTRVRSASVAETSEASDFRAGNVTESELKEKIDSYLHLIAADDMMKASATLLEMLPEIVASRLHRQEKISHLIYLPRLLQRAPGAKHGVRKLLAKAGSIERRTAGIEIPRHGHFVDFGCGTHDPIALAIYFYVNGFDKTFAIDLSPLKDELYSAVATYDLLANMRLFPHRYCWRDSSAADISRRIEVLEAEAFERGDLRAGLATATGKFHYEPVDILESSVEPASVALLVSFAVFEHVSDVDEVCKKIYDSLMPGGVAYHFIDMADHRSYQFNAKHGPLSFLGEERPFANVNRMRKSEHIAAQQRAGFDIVKMVATKCKLTDDVRQGLAERFRDFDDDDLATIKLMLTVRKPRPEV